MEENEVLKKLEYFRYRRGLREALRDIFQIMALYVSTKMEKYCMNITPLSPFLDLQIIDEREHLLEQVRKSYESEELKVIDDISAMLYFELTKMGLVGTLTDELGKLYMNKEISLNENGQFFSPPSVGQLLSKLVIQKRFHNGVYTILDDTCGSGGLLIEAFKEAETQYPNTAADVLLVGTDLDYCCVSMAYLQLAFAGAAAVIRHGDSLLQKFRDVWYTPAFLLNYNDFMEY